MPIRAYYGLSIILVRLSHEVKMGRNRHFPFFISVLSGWHKRGTEVNTGKLSIFGDSILKGVQLDEQSGKYKVDNGIGFEGLADRAGLTVENFSKFGCTLTKAWSYVQKMFGRIDADIILMDFGGNDCDFDWKAISESPMDIHKPNTEFFEFVDTYNRMVDFILSKGSLPVLLTLVPIQGASYINYQCKSQGIDKNNILKWLGGDESRICNYQRIYSDAIKGVASTRDVPMLDIWSAFEAKGDVSSLICKDGIHPNSRGQKVIHDCFSAFLDDYLAC